MIKMPQLNTAEKLDTSNKRLLITAYGFEERSLGWSKFQAESGKIIDTALVIKYNNSKGKNKLQELKKNLKNISLSKPIEVSYSIYDSEDFETILEEKLDNIEQYDEIILDITALTKFLILILLCKLSEYQGICRIVYSEAEFYAPTEDEFNDTKNKIKKVIHFPSRGFGTILRAKCLSSIRMQGQNVTLVAFTSFNEQLVRHMLGTISPHHLIFINGKPPRAINEWREQATLQLHTKLIKEYPDENVFNHNVFTRTASTLDYYDATKIIEEIYNKLGLFERIIIAATGSKMQTIGLFFAKMRHPDIHIEYPTPDSYYIKGFSKDIKNIHEIKIENLKLLISGLRISITIP